MTEHTRWRLCYVLLSPERLSDSWCVYVRACVCACSGRGHQQRWVGTGSGCSLAGTRLLSLQCKPSQHVQTSTLWLFVSLSCLIYQSCNRTRWHIREILLAADSVNEVSHPVQTLKKPVTSALKRQKEHVLECHFSSCLSHELYSQSEQFWTASLADA